MSFDSDITLSFHQADTDGIRTDREVDGLFQIYLTRDEHGQSSMTRDEFSVIMDSMSEGEYTHLQRSFGITASRNDFARQFARHPEWDETLSDLLDVPTEHYREVAAIKSVAKAAALSAIESQQAKAQSGMALKLSIAAMALSVVALALAALPYVLRR